MKNNIFLVLLFLSSIAFGQETCIQYFEAPGLVGPVLHINASDFTCYGGIPESITVTYANLGSGCDSSVYPEYELDLDGVITRVCENDMIGMDITGFTSLTISSDYGNMDIKRLGLTAVYTSVSKPPCNAVMTTPVNGATNVEANNQQFVFSPASDATGYHVQIGTESGVANFVYQDVPSNSANIYSGELPFMQFNTTYYVKIIPYNSFGDATGCTEYSFTTRPLPITPGNVCQNPIVVGSLPYVTTDQMANYESVNYIHHPGNSCEGPEPLYWWSTTAKDVVYAYTATFTGSINAYLQTPVTGYGLFAYGSCADIGQNCIGSSYDMNGFDPIKIQSLAVVEGQTYYFLIRSYYPGEEIMDGKSYTFTITEDTCLNAVATYSVISDCSTTPQFNVAIDITDMGTATSLLISDNQSSTTQTVFDAGVITFGPYSMGTSVVFSIANSNDANCVVTSLPYTQGNCEPICENAPTVLVDEVVTANFEAGSGSWNIPSTSNYYYLIWDMYKNGDELIYSFTPPIDAEYFFESTYDTATTQNRLFIKEATGSCDAVGWESLGWGDEQIPASLGQLTAGNTYWLLLDGYRNEWEIEDLPFLAYSKTFTIKMGQSINCIPATASAILVSDCPTPEFHYTVDVTDMGSATSLTITDGLDSPNQTLTDIGSVTFGPYSNGAYPDFTVTNTDDATCFVTAYVDNYQISCPGLNDLCENAILLNCGETLDAESTANSTLDDTTTCSGDIGNDVWYKFTGTGMQERLLMQISPIVDAEGNSSNPEGIIEVFESTDGSCSGFSLGSCVSSSLVIPPNNYSNSQALIAFVSVLGKEYYIRVGSNDIATDISFYLYHTCVTPAINDDLCNAITLTVGAQSTGTTYSNDYCTSQANEPIPSCFQDGIKNSVWFKFVAPPSGNIKITTDIVGGSLKDSEIAVYDSTGVVCGDLSTLQEPVGCDQDSGLLVFFNSILYLPTLVPSNTYYIQVDKWSGYEFPIPNQTFGIEVLDMGNLVTSTVDQQGFLVYPNPVKNILNLSYNNNIEKVLVYNLLGQEVAAKSNADNTQIDMSSLASGTYLVKISSGDKVKTMKVIKE